MSANSHQWNNIGSSEDALVALGHAVGGSSSLATLDLRNNRISGDGCAAFVRAAKGNTNLASLGAHHPMLCLERTVLS